MGTADPVLLVLVDGKYFGKGFLTGFAVIIIIGHTTPSRENSALK